MDAAADTSVELLQERLHQREKELQIARSELSSIRDHVLHQTSLQKQYEADIRKQVLQFKEGYERELSATKTELERLMAENRNLVEKLQRAEFSSTEDHVELSCKIDELTNSLATVTQSRDSVQQQFQQFRSVSEARLKDVAEKVQALMKSVVSWRTRALQLEQQLKDNEMASKVSFEQYQQHLQRERELRELAESSTVKESTNAENWQEVSRLLETTVEREIRGALSQMEAAYSSLQQTAQSTAISAVSSPIPLGTSVDRAEAAVQSEGRVDSPILHAVERAPADNADERVAMLQDRVLELEGELDVWKLEFKRMLSVSIEARPQAAEAALLQEKLKQLAMEVKELRYKEYCMEKELAAQQSKHDASVGQWQDVAQLSALLVQCIGNGHGELPIAVTAQPGDAQARDQRSNSATGRPMHMRSSSDVLLAPPAADNHLVVGSRRSLSTPPEVLTGAHDDSGGLRERRNVPLTVETDLRASTQSSLTNDSYGQRSANAVHLDSLIVFGLPGESGIQDGPSIGQNCRARFKSPSAAIFHEKKQVLFVADSGNRCIRKVHLKDGLVTTISRVDDARKLDLPVSLSLSTDGSHLYVADRGKRCVWKVHVARGGEPALAFRLRGVKEKLTLPVDPMQRKPPSVKESVRHCLVDRRGLLYVSTGARVIMFNQRSKQIVASVGSAKELGCDDGTFQSAAAHTKASTTQSTVRFDGCGAMCFIDDAEVKLVVADERNARLRVIDWAKGEVHSVKFANVPVHPTFVTYDPGQKLMFLCGYYGHDTTQSPRNFVIDVRKGLSDTCQCVEVHISAPGDANNSSPATFCSSAFIRSNHVLCIDADMHCMVLARFAEA